MNAFSKTLMATAVASLLTVGVAGAQTVVDPKANPTPPASSMPSNTPRPDKTMPAPMGKVQAGQSTDVGRSSDTIPSDARTPSARTATNMAYNDAMTTAKSDYKPPWRITGAERRACQKTASTDQKMAMSQARTTRGDTMKMESGAPGKAVSP